MLYSLNAINNKIAHAYKSNPQKVDIIKFFTEENIINIVGINEVFMHDKHPPYFVSEKSMEKIANKIKESFDVDFPFKDFYSGKMSLLSLEDDKSAQRFTVKSIEDFNKLKSLHSEYSTYGIEAQKQKEIQDAKKQEKVAKIEAEHEANREASRKEFDGLTNLNRDFGKSKIVSFDFEFSFNKHKNDYMVTEMGVAISDKGKETTFHYLIQENYEKKRNRSMQDKFDFGQTEVLPFTKIKAVINEHLKGADYVLFHEMREDYDIMKRLGYDFENKKDIQIIDTQLCYKRYFRPKNSLPNGEKLENLLDSFKIQAKHLHNGGNDAKYTLMLLLKMSAIHKMMLDNKKESSPSRPKIK